MRYWAKIHFGPGYLDRCRPTPILQQVIDELTRLPWQNRREITKNTGVPKPALERVLQFGRESGKLVRRKGRKGLYEWSVAGVK